MTDDVFRPFEGMPTRPDVDALLKAFPPETIKSGEWSVTDEQMFSVLGASTAADYERYIRISLVWRRRLERDHRVVVYRQNDAGFYAPTPDQIFGRTESSQTHALRTIRKQKRGVALAKPTDARGAEIQLHRLRLLDNSSRALRQDREALQLPATTAAQPPQIVPPTAQR